MSISVSRSAVRTDCTPKPRSFWAKLDAFFAVSRQRRHLVELDNRMLKDIGVSRNEALEEGRQAMWNVPNHWRY